MKDEIERLVKQFQILESAAAEKTGSERAALQKRAAEIKMEIIKLLPKRGQQPESKIPDPNKYFSAQLPEGFENYFPGDYLTPDIESYFNNLTPDMDRYFTTREDLYDGAPSMPLPVQPTIDDGEERRKLRQRILRAVGC
ncbi:hypothetical protein ACF1MF_002796 [Salmonella enterica]